MSDWLPIDTAPERDRVLIKTEDDRVFIASYRCYNVGGKTWSDDHDDDDFTPIGWMPLPSINPPSKWKHIDEPPPEGEEVIVYDGHYDQAIGAYYHRGGFSNDGELLHAILWTEMPVPTAEEIQAAKEKQSENR